MKLSEIGEFGLIDAIAGLLEKRQPRSRYPSLLLGAGEDDAAAWLTRPGVQVATADTLTQDIDFKLDLASWSDVGWKALAVNLSDIAAMGAVPTYALVSLELPPETEMESVLELYSGMLDLAERFNVAIVGGDTGAAREVSIAVALWGEAEGEGMAGPEMLLRRSVARPGDLVAVTGFFGASAAGLRLLLSKLELSPGIKEQLRQAHLRPWPRVREGRILVACGVKAAIDVSDGLVDDLGKLCRASKVGARLWVERVPVAPTCYRAFPELALEMALAGGEDFELLFTAPPDIIDRVQGSMPTPVTVIGEIIDIAGRVELLDSRGQPYEIRGHGWEHFHTTSQTTS